MIEIYPDYESLSDGVARLVAESAQQARESRGRFCIALAGGETPRKAYELLAHDRYRNLLDWNLTHVFWGDERCVSRGDPRSNARMAHEALLSHVPIPTAQIHPIECADDARAAAYRYERELGAFFNPGPPAFDFILLGLGENGHTASLFPYTPVLEAGERWVSEVCVEEQQLYRVTFTSFLINQAALVAFMVSGAGKAGVLREVIEGPREVYRLPAQLICPHNGELRWLVDEQAAAALDLTPPRRS